MGCDGAGTTPGGAEGARGRAPGGTDEEGWLGDVAEPSPDTEEARERLNVRQHDGHRHSMTTLPSAAFLRLSRHPNCALISV